jgi:hypothetical protein
VVLRPQQRARRNRFAAAVIAVLSLGVLAGATLFHLKQTVGNPFVYLRETYLPSLVAIEVVAQPEALKDAAEEILAEHPRASAGAQAAALRERLDCLKTVTIRRSWLRRRARLELVARAAVAAAKLKDGAPGFLSDDGAAFEAPEGVYGLKTPLAELGAAGAADLAAAAAFLKASSGRDAVPSPVASLKWAAQDGWAARLEDGTQVLWGDGRWPSEKLARLREVVVDARARRDPPEPFVVDLRYFEDGKVLLRPLPPRAVSMR